MRLPLSPSSTRTVNILFAARYRKKFHKISRQPLLCKNLGSYDKHSKTTPPPHSPPLPNNFVYEDMIEIVENDVGQLVCSYIHSTTLLEGEGGEMKKILHCLQKVCYDLPSGLSIFCKGLKAQTSSSHKNILYHSYSATFRCTFVLSIQDINSCLVLWYSKAPTKIGIYSLPFKFKNVVRKLFTRGM